MDKRLIRDHLVTIAWMIFVLAAVSAFAYVLIFAPQILVGVAVVVFLAVLYRGIYEEVKSE